MTHDSLVPLCAADFENAIACAASYQVPLLWLALFATADVASVELPLEDDAGNSTVGTAPTLYTTLPKAVACYGVRRQRILEAVPNELHKHVTEFEDLLNSFRARFVQVDLAELWMMHSDEEFRAYLPALLAGMDGSSEEGWTDALEQAGFAQSTSRLSYDPQVARFGLRGYEWTLPVPWQDE